ncbi:MAG: TCP-1/cpn60 chaperonin family protein [Micropruina sp.]
MVAKAVVEPLRWIAENGGEPGCDRVEGGGAGARQGPGAATGEYGDLVAAGVIDPVKVTRSALANAGLIAALLLTTETLVVEKPEEDDENGHKHWGPNRKPPPIRVGVFYIAGRALSRPRTMSRSPSMGGSPGRFGS